MLDATIYFLLNYTYVIIGLLFLLKTILFIRHKNKNWRLSEFLYFNQLNIRFTPNLERAKLKRLQNFLSYIILFLLVVQLVILALFKGH